jgi:hypothetical protein
LIFADILNNRSSAALAGLESRQRSRTVNKRAEDSLLVVTFGTATLIACLTTLLLTM